MTEQTNIAPATKVLRAFRSGDVVFIETDEHHTASAVAKMQECLHESLADTGVRVVLLAKGMRLAAREEVPA